METIVRRPDQGATEQDYYSVLAGVVVSASQDHAQLRALIFDLARIKLRKDLMLRFQEVGASGMRLQLQALDAAIERIEADFAFLSLPSSSPLALTTATREEDDTTVDDQPDDPPSALRAGSQPPATFADDDAPIRYSFGLPAVQDTPRIVPAVTITEQGAQWEPAGSGSRFRTAFWSTIQMTIAAALGAAIYVAIDAGWLSKHREVAASVVAMDATKGRANDGSRGKDVTARSEAPPRPAIPGIPLPSAYGVYALSDGQLVDLDLLPISVPDPRVALSTVISKPGRVHLPGGPLQFVVFRRDLLNHAPDKVMVRVVARVARALTFGRSGKPKVAEVDDAWIVRSNSYQMSVAPVPDNPEMVLVRPAPPEIVFPAGRYALVLKNLAYDFTLDGPLTDPAHCLERTDTLNNPVYTECRNL
jgi:hypothetical protein